MPPRGKEGKASRLRRKDKCFYFILYTAFADSQFLLKHVFVCIWPSYCFAIIT